MAGNAVAQILQELNDRFDTVIIDAPPLLHVGDALTLGSRVDALIVVVRYGTARIGTLRELRHALDTSRAPTLGLVLTGTNRQAEYGGGYYHTPSAQPEPARVR